MARGTPTEQAMGALQEAYNHFNRSLFGDLLPHVLLTLQRKSARVYGYFSPKRFTDGSDRTADELAMNPMHFLGKDASEALATLVHEMAHVWQEHYGSPGRGRYHNKEWGEKMKDVGLFPSNTGAPGGKQTGDQMMHYVIRGGAFERESARLQRSGFRWPWGEGSGVGESPKTPGTPKEPKDKSNRVRFDCPGEDCKTKAWAKPTASLMCGKCKRHLAPHERGGED